MREKYHPITSAVSVVRSERRWVREAALVKRRYYLSLNFTISGNQSTWIRFCFWPREIRGKELVVFTPELWAYYVLSINILYFRLVTTSSFEIKTTHQFYRIMSVILQTFFNAFQLIQRPIDSKFHFINELSNFSYITLIIHSDTTTLWPKPKPTPKLKALTHFFTVLHFR